MTHKKYCVIYASLFLFVIACLFATFDIMKRRAEVRILEAKSRLAQLRHIIVNYEAVHNKPLCRTYTSSDGIVTGWRQELSAFLDEFEAPRNSDDVDETKETLKRGQILGYLRLSFDKGDENDTSIIGVYSPTVSNDPGDSPWAIVAMTDSGIEWNEPRDLTLKEFEQMLSRPEGTSKPIALLTADKHLGVFSHMSICFSTSSPGQPPIEQLLLRRTCR